MLQVPTCCSSTATACSILRNSTALRCVQYFRGPLPLRLMLLILFSPIRVQLAVPRLGAELHTHRFRTLSRTPSRSANPRREKKKKKEEPGTA